ncbi:MAG: MFS transporter [Thermoproteota archaeon]
MGEENKRTRRNFLALLLDWVMYGTGMNFVSATTVLPAFVSSITDSKIAIGLVSTIPVMFWNSLQLISAGRIEKIKYKKPFLLRITPGERIPWLVIFIFTILMATKKPFVLLLVFYAAYIIINIFSGLCSTAWFDIVAKAIPEEKRGIYFSTANLISSITGLLGGIVVAFYMGFFQYPINYSLCFLTAFIFILVSWIAIYQVDEPPSDIVEESSSIREYVKRLPAVLKGNRNYALYTLSGMIGAFGGISSSFYTAYAIYRFNASDFDIGLFTIVLVGTQIASNILWMFVQAKYGHKAVLLVGGSAGTFATIIAVLASSLNHFLLVFALTGVSFSAFLVSNFPILMEMAPEEEVPTYIGLNSALKSLFLAAAPLFGGLMIEEYGYTLAFMVSFLFSAVSTILMAMVKHEKRIHREALREKLIKRF